MNSKIHLLVSGEPEEKFRSFVYSNLKGDYYISLETIRESFLASSEFFDIEFCLAVVEDSVLYALVGGGGAIFLKRNGKNIPLLRTLKGTASLVSGNVRPDDLFELNTSVAERTFSAYEQDSKPNQSIARQKIANFIDKLLSKIPEPKITISKENDRAKKASLVGFVLLLMLGVSIYFGLQRRADIIRRSEYEPKLAAAEHDLKESLELAMISRSRSRELILRASSLTKELLAAGIKDQRLDNLAAEISKHLGKIAGIYEMTPGVFFDLTIIVPAFEGSDMALSGNELRVLDSKQKRLVGIGLPGKATRVIAGPNYLPDALRTVAYENRSFVLSSDGVREVTKEVELVIKSEWNPENVLLEAYAGNLYVLDRSANQIWRYQGVVGGFLEKKAWLGEGFKKDTSDAFAWAIDGAIWTVNKRGGFKVYSLGAPQAFSVRGSPSPFNNIEDIYVKEKSNLLYVLDSGSKRVSVIRKNGDYVAEYIASELASANKIAVDEGNRLLLFLANGKLYFFDLKHLDENS